jgi:transketolase
LYDIERMRRLSADIRIETIRALAAAGYGHIGGSMSIADALGALYGGVMNIRPDEPEWEERDFLVLSKGHCGPALYAALALLRYFPVEELKTVNRGGTRLPSHCDRLKTPGVDMSTGSLGQGISSAAGIALGNRLKGLSSYTYCIIGDGECQEGQVWEAAELAAQLNLDHLIVLIDENKRQLDGPVAAIRTGQDLEAKWRAFGWRVEHVAGWDVGAIAAAIDRAKLGKGAPAALILDTFKGLGANFAEAAAFNHYMVITADMAEEAVREIERRYATGAYPRGDVRW